MADGFEKSSFDLVHKLDHSFVFVIMIVHRGTARGQRRVR